MTNQPPGGASSQPAGQPAKPSNQGGEGKGAEPQFATVEQVQAMMVEAEEQGFRRAQALFDKGMNRSDAERKVGQSLADLTGMAERMKARGVEIPPAALEAERQAIIAGHFEAAAKPPSTEGESAGAGPGQGETPAGEAPDPITALAWRRVEKAGIDLQELIDANDPAVALIDTKTKDELVFLESVDAFIAAVQERGSGGDESEVETRVARGRLRMASPGGGAAAGGTQSGPPAGLTPEQLLERGYARTGPT